MTMPTATKMFAMYVTGEVESGWRWDAVNYNDPITIGMFQNYAYNAARLLNMVKNDSNGTDWAYIVANAPTISAAVNAHPVSDSDYWETRKLTKAEGTVLAHIMRSDANHVLQQNMFFTDAENAYNKMLEWGVPADHPREMVFCINMYHQSKKRCQQVIQAAGGDASLSKLKTTALNNIILRNYATRYNKVYARLVAWDGVSNPPDFGQVYTGEEEDPDVGGDLEPDTVQGTSELGYIVQQGNDLILFGKNLYKKGVVFHAAAGQRWLNGSKPDVVTIDTDTTPNDPNPTTRGARLSAYVQSLIGTMTYELGATGRLTPVTSGRTDCSGLMYWVFKHVLGMSIGTWTGDQKNKGTKIYGGAPSGMDWGNAQEGDLIFYARNSTTISHVEMYVGGGKCCGIGGGTGPTIKNDAGRANWFTYIVVRRLI